MFAMELKRTRQTQYATLGELYINGVFFCYTLEDVVREKPLENVAVWKVPGKTAVPVGTYDVVVDFSNRFQRLMPHVLNVPGFDGIRIHPGNTDADTEGCILLGRSIEGPDFIGQSRDAFNEFFPKLSESLAANEQPTITITNNFPAPDVTGEVA